MNAMQLRQKTEEAKQSIGSADASLIIAQAKAEADKGKSELFWCRNISNSTLNHLQSNGYITYHSLIHGIIYLSKITW